MKECQELDLAGCYALVQSVIVTACEDYRKLLKRRARGKADQVAMSNIRALERFFRSEYFSLLTELDPEAMIERLNREVNEHGRI